MSAVLLQSSAVDVDDFVLLVCLVNVSNHYLVFLDFLNNANFPVSFLQHIDKVINLEFSPVPRSFWLYVSRPVSINLNLNHEHCSVSHLNVH